MGKLASNHFHSDLFCFSGVGICAIMEDEQIKQMIQFITNEAEEKKNDLEQKANEEYDTEKAKIINSRRPLIREEIHKKKQKEKQHMAIARSTAINKHRLKLIKERQAKVDAVKELAEKELQKDASNEKLIADLMTEGLLMLLESEVKVSCRKADVSVVTAAIPKAKAKYSETISTKTGGKVKKAVEVTVAEAKLDDSALGGVVLSCNDGAITIDNTIAARLSLVMEQAKPEIKKTLFP